MSAAQPLADLAHNMYAASRTAQGDVWHTLRQEALEHLKQGLDWPSNRSETWRYMPLSALTQRHWHTSADFTHNDVASLEETSSQGLRLVFVDGHLDLKHTRLPENTPLVVDSLRTLSAQNPHPLWLKKHLGKHQLHTRMGLCALNTAGFEDGYVIYLPKGMQAKQVIEIVYVHQSTDPEARLYQPRNLIIAEAHAQACILETYLGPRQAATWTNAVTELYLGAHARIDYVLQQQQSDATEHTHITTAALQAHAQLNGFLLATGGARARSEWHIALQKEHACARLNGLYLTTGRTHHDVQVEMQHAHPHTQSKQNFRGILSDAATGVFCGSVYVAPDAIQTDAQQLCRNLLLSPQAHAHAQPRLEILADDVKCTHGATVGDLHDDALFYLQSRGIDQATAKRLLAYAFAADVLADSPEMLRERLITTVKNHMQLDFGQELI